MLDFQRIAVRVAEAIVESLPADDIMSESDEWEGRGGTSAEVRRIGLHPAFRYRPTGEVFSDPDTYVHLSTTVPRMYWAEVDADGDLRRLVPGIEQGFVDAGGQFYTRAEAAAMLMAAMQPAVT